MCPMRSCAQIYDEARKFTYQTGVRPVVVYGGAPQQQQVRGGRRGGGESRQLGDSGAIL